MSPFNEITSPPMIEITISRTVLRQSLVVVPLGLLLLLGVIGAAVSPLVNGYPVFLTRERLAQFITDFPQVAEVEINPLRVMIDSAAALDARIRVEGHTRDAVPH